jgi:hypothetical protein
VGTVGLQAVGVLAVVTAGRQTPPQKARVREGLNKKACQTSNTNRQTGGRHLK